jgi:hypothetical protein
MRGMHAVFGSANELEGTVSQFSDCHLGQRQVKILDRGQVGNGTGRARTAHCLLINFAVA